MEHKLGKHDFSWKICYHGNSNFQFSDSELLNSILNHSLQTSLCSFVIFVDVFTKKQSKENNGSWKSSR